MQSTSSLHPFRGTADHIVMRLPTKVDAVRQILQTLRAHGISDDQIGLAMQQVGGDMSLGGGRSLSDRAEAAKAQWAEVSLADLRASLPRPCRLHSRLSHFVGRSGAE